MSCASQLKDWQQCLSKSNRRASKCSSKEEELRKCAKPGNLNFCIDETVGLLNCSRSPNKDFCSKQFVSMRECNRLGGPELFALPEGGWGVAESARSSFSEESVLRQPPPTQNGDLKNIIFNYMQQLGMGDIIRF